MSDKEKNWGLLKNNNNVCNKIWVEVRKIATSARGPKKKGWVEIAGIFRTGASKTSIAIIEKKIATIKNQLSKKTVAPKLYNFLPAATINWQIIAKLEED